MEETNTTPTAPQGKGMAVAGFVISLVALIFYFIIAVAVAAQAIMGGGFGLGVLKIEHFTFSGKQRHFFYTRKTISYLCRSIKILIVDVKIVK